MNGSRRIAADAGLVAQSRGLLEMTSTNPDGGNLAVAGSGQDSRARGGAVVVAEVRRGERCGQKGPCSAFSGSWAAISLSARKRGDELPGPKCGVNAPTGSRYPAAMQRQRGRAGTGDLDSAEQRREGEGLGAPSSRLSRGVTIDHDSLPPPLSPWGCCHCRASDRHRLPTVCLGLNPVCCVHSSLYPVGRLPSVP